jgi:hypothetical protein
MTGRHTTQSLRPCLCSTRVLPARHEPLPRASSQGFEQAQSFALLAVKRTWCRNVTFATSGPGESQACFFVGKSTQPLPVASRKSAVQLVQQPGRTCLSCTKEVSSSICFRARGESTANHIQYCFSYKHWKEPQSWAHSWLHGAWAQ